MKKARGATAKGPCRKKTHLSERPSHQKDGTAIEGKATRQAFGRKIDGKMEWFTKLPLGGFGGRTVAGKDNHESR